jgi:hypothetical protein
MNEIFAPDRLSLLVSLRLDRRVQNAQHLISGPCGQATGRLEIIVCSVYYQACTLSHKNNIFLYRA